MRTRAVAKEKADREKGYLEHRTGRNWQMGNEGEESDGYPRIGCDLHIADTKPKSLKIFWRKK